MSKRLQSVFADVDYWAVIDKALSMSREDVINTIKKSQLRGRGGAGFPTGIKWEAVYNQNALHKYVICNADEGEPGTFKDREILQRQGEKVFAGMALAAYAVGAEQGILYLRWEYHYLLAELEQKLARFNEGLKTLYLNFSIIIRLGSGAYVCGEETALLQSLEGKRGEARNKPPYPVEKGYLGYPSLINNVETFVYCMQIIKIGAEEFLSHGSEFSRGSKMFCVSGDTPVPGIYELELGMKLSDFVSQFGDKDTKAVQVGGSSGYCVPRKLFEETVIGFEGVPTGGSMMLFNSSRSMYNILHNYLEFFTEESCGQCTPCRVGCVQLLKGIEAVKRGEKPSSYIDTLIQLGSTMAVGSKCGLGQSVPHPFLSIITHFREEIVF